LRRWVYPLIGVSLAAETTQFQLSCFSGRGCMPIWRAHSAASLIASSGISGWRLDGPPHLPLAETLSGQYVANDVADEGPSTELNPGVDRKHHYGSALAFVAGAILRPWRCSY
jgi:hypothetical protein